MSMKLLLTHHQLECHSQTLLIVIIGISKRNATLQSGEGFVLGKPKLHPLTTKEFERFREAFSEVLVSNNPSISNPHIEIYERYELDGK